MAPIIIGLISLWLFMNHYLVSGFLVWVLFPLSRFILIGSFKNRILNVLPIVVFLLYLSLSMENQDFGKYDWVLFLTPLGSLILKPKKHQVEYLTLIIS